MCWCMSRPVDAQRCEYVQVNAWVSVIRNAKMNVRVNGQSVCECGGGVC